MKTKHIFWGTLFISIGILVLMNNFSTFDLYWGDIWKFWPVVLVLWGITILVKDKFFKSILAGASGLILALVIFTTFKSAAGVFSDNFWNSRDFEISMDSSDNIQHFREPFNSNYKYAYLHFASGAGAFSIAEPTGDLIDATTTGADYDFSVDSDSGDNRVSLDLSMEDHRFNFYHGKLKNKARLSLNTGPEWDMDFEIGAASAELDLSPYKTRNVTIDMGAASLKLKLGSLADESHIKVKGGASAIHIFVPMDAGCDISADINLSSRHFRGFDKLSWNHYQTGNFDSARKKIYLTIDTGVSSVSVTRTDSW